MNETKNAGAGSATETKARAYRLQRTLTNRFAAYLMPGERVSVVIEIENDFVYSKWTVATPRMESRLDVEAVLISQDQEMAFVKSHELAARLEFVLSFLEGQVADYFRQARRPRFHDDWRIYPYEEALIRFRGEWTSPHLRDQADAFLELAGEDPDA